MSPRYLAEVTLASKTAFGMRVDVKVKNDVLHVMFLDYRDNPPDSPAHLRYMTESEFPAPVMPLRGQFDEDSMLAESWLAVHHARVRDAERIKR